MGRGEDGREAEGVGQSVMSLGRQPPSQGEATSTGGTCWYRRYYGSQWRPPEMRTGKLGPRAY